MYKMFTQIVKGNFEEKVSDSVGTRSVRKVAMKYDSKGRRSLDIVEFEIDFCEYNLEAVKKLVEDEYHKRYSSISESELRFIANELGKNGVDFTTITSMMESAKRQNSSRRLIKDILRAANHDESYNYYWFDFDDMRYHFINRRMSASMKAVIEAKQTVIRRDYNPETGVFDTAFFANGDKIYMLKSNGDIAIVNGKYSLDNPRYLSRCKQFAVYDFVSLNTVPVYTHILTKLLLTNDYGESFARYMSSNNMVINHMVNVPREYALYDVQRKFIPDERYIANPNYLEVVTSAHNTEAGIFCNTYNIFGVPFAIESPFSRDLMKLVQKEYDKNPTMNMNTFILGYYKSRGYFSDFDPLF